MMCLDIDYKFSKKSPLYWRIFIVPLNLIGYLFLTNVKAQTPGRLTDTYSKKKEQIIIRISNYS